MRLIRYMSEGKAGLGIVDRSGAARGMHHEGGNLPEIEHVLALGDDEQTCVWEKLANAPVLEPGAFTYLPPVCRPEKTICVGLNYTDHTAESGFEQPSYPTFFPRFASSLIGHGAPIIRPSISDSLDFEGELVAVIGKAGRHIAHADALDHVFGYSIFNDGSVREYQFKTPQWTVGKNFDDTGAFGPALVTKDELPAGADGLRLETRLNGETVQFASTADMLFSIADLISIVSQAMRLRPGDLLVAGTPSGIGWAREPKLLMRDGDTCEVEIEGIGLLSNPIQNEKPVKSAEA